MDISPRDILSSPRTVRLQEAVLTLVVAAQCADVIMGHEWALGCLFPGAGLRNGQRQAAPWPEFH